MSDIKLEKTTTNIGNDTWFKGQNVVGPNGGECYFICQFMDGSHYNDETKEFYPYCKHRKTQLFGGECTMECDQFGMCSTCRGFSAIRCQECDILRP